MSETYSVYVKNVRDLHSWLLKNHVRKDGLWLIFDKGKDRALSVNDIVDELLCFGWIDSKVGKVDASRTKVWIAPRKPKSNWSRVNKEKISRLEIEGRMHANGKAVVALAKRSGTWTALDEVENLTLPQDLKSALDSHRGARKYFDAFPRSVKRGILEWIMNAKKPETRAARIAETARLAAKNIRANQYRPAKK